MKILHVISSPRKEASFSIKLGNEIIERLLRKHPGSTVATHNLTETPFPHMEEVHLHSFFTEPGLRTPELVEAVKHSDEAIQELMDADIIVIGVPMYNFSIHSTLKAWLDHVMRAGVTFKYSEAGVEGLLKNKKVYLAVSSGGIYSDGPMQSFDFTAPYLLKVLNFIGITDVTTYRVEGVNLPTVKDKALDTAFEKIAV
jgi:FMN-dependent NADH-azoreductase